MNSQEIETQIYKNELAQDIYSARTIILEVEELLKNGNYPMLDDRDYREEFFQLLKKIKNTLKDNSSERVVNSCTVVARSLRDTDYIDESFKINRLSARNKLAGQNQEEKARFSEAIAPESRKM